MQIDNDAVATSASAEFDNPISRLRRRLKACGIPSEAMTHLRPEIDGLSNSTDRKTIEYYQCLADLPWRSGEAETVDVQCAQRLLDDGHFGLAGPKMRILEYLAVRHRTRDARGAVLCLVGPPGVGKTSLAASIAEVLGRKFAEISCNSLRETADVHGARRDYAASKPGQIMQQLRSVGVKNPVFVLDEIDKVSPAGANALLNALDPMQNDRFHRQGLRASRHRDDARRLRRNHGERNAVVDREDDGDHRELRTAETDGSHLGNQVRRDHDQDQHQGTRDNGQRGRTARARARPGTTLGEAPEPARCTVNPDVGRRQAPESSADPPKDRAMPTEKHEPQRYAETPAATWSACVIDETATSWQIKRATGAEASAWLRNAAAKYRHTGLRILGAVLVRAPDPPLLLLASIRCTNVLEHAVDAGKVRWAGGRRPMMATTVFWDGTVAFDMTLTNATPERDPVGDRMARREILYPDNPRILMIDIAPENILTIVGPALCPVMEVTDWMTSTAPGAAADA